MVFYTDHGAVMTRDNGDTFRVLPMKQFHPRSCGGGAWDPAPGSQRIITSIGGWSKQRLILSEDNGATWTVVRKERASYRNFIFHPQKPKIVYVGVGRGGLRSDDNGRAWQALAHAPRAMRGANGDILFAARKTGKKPGRLSEYEVLRSTDRGATWQALPGRIEGIVGDLVCDPAPGGRVYAGTTNGVWIFNGKTWRQKNEKHGLTRNHFGKLIFNKLALDPSRPKILYAATRYSWVGRAGGIFRSTDFGETWTNIIGNLGPYLTVWKIVVSPHDGTVFISSDYGTWRLDK